MNKKEFLDELQNALNGKLSQSDVGEILSDYGDLFEGAAAEGKSEEETAAKIGSPARIARTILEDSADTDRASSESGRKGMDASKQEGREYTDFQRNINEKTSSIFDKIMDPDKNAQIEQLAPMPRRLGAYLIDSILLGGVLVGGILALLVPITYNLMTKTSSSVIVNGIPADMGGTAVKAELLGSNGGTLGLAIGNFFIMMFLLGASNLLTTVIIWATDGYTPGKWFLKMRVVKLNGAKLSFLDAVLRELVIKCIANSILSGILNIGSFIWGCVTEDHKTVHDMVAQTRVLAWDRDKSRKTSNPVDL
jgi:uncharacterized RDD family membrane protein YckC